MSSSSSPTTDPRPRTAGETGASVATLLGPRETTRTSWRDSVERAVAYMRANLEQALSLEQLARAALMSPYHFNRVFRLVTGIPPGQFLTALRMAEAKHLLLTTSQRVTDVCFAVGFESLGTFTTRFGQLVGVAPQELRRLADRHGARPVTWLADADACLERDPTMPSIRGWLSLPSGESCVTLVGLFDRAVPQGMPSACSIVGRAPGPFRIAGAATGSHHVLAVGFRSAQTVLDAALLAPHRLIVGGLPEPIEVGSRDGADLRVRILLDPPATVGPPIVLAAPLLAAEARSHAWASRRSRAVACTA